LLIPLAFPLTEGGACAALVDMPVGDTGAVVFSLVKALAAVTLLASNAGFTPVAFVPVAFLEVVVVPFVVDGIMVSPIIVLFDIDINPLFIDVDDEDVFVCCANTSDGLLSTNLGAKIMPSDSAPTKQIADLIVGFIV
jgi:hypothetical protein